MKTLIKIISLLLLILTSALAGAQKQWTLEDCINYAVEHNIRTKQLALQKEEAATSLNTAKSERTPNLNIGLGQNWNFGRSNNNQTGIYEDKTVSNSYLSASSSMPLFSGFQINHNIKRQRLNLEAATQQLEKAKEDLALNITALYLQVLFNKELLKVAEEKLNLSKQQVERTQVLVQAGKFPKAQLFDVEAQAAQDEFTRIEAKNNLILSLLELAQSLELENFLDFDAEDPQFNDFSGDNIQLLNTPDAVYANAVQTKASIKQQEYLLESSRKYLKVVQSSYYPRLSLSLSYNNSYFYDYGSQQNTRFNDQISNNAGEAIGLSLNIPIFNRNQVRNQVKSAKIGVQNQELELENTKKALFKEIQVAYSNALASQEKYQAANRAVLASQESFKYAQERYDVGALSVFEFNESKNRLTQSESSQIQAKYDYLFRIKILDFYNGQSLYE